MVCPITMRSMLSFLVMALWCAVGVESIAFPYESCSMKQTGSSPYIISELTLPKPDRLCMRFSMKDVRGKRCTDNYATSLELEISDNCGNAAHIIAMAGGVVLDVEITVRQANATSLKTMLILSGSSLTRCLEKGCKVCLYLLGACTNLQALTEGVGKVNLALVDSSRACCAVMPLDTSPLMPPLPPKKLPPAHSPIPAKTSPPTAKPSPARTPSPKPAAQTIPSPPPVRPKVTSSPPPSVPRPYVPSSPQPATASPDAPSAPPPSPSHPSSPASPPDMYNQDVSSYNLVLGTQQFNPRYGFTGKSAIVEAADVIQEMGSNILKMHTDITKYLNVVWKANGVDFASPSRTIKDVFSKHPDMVEVLDRPQLKYYLFWTYVRSNEQLAKGFEGFATNKAALKTEYQEMYDAAYYLLTTYQGTGKTFFLGNWEGDWMLKSGLDSDQGPAGMIAWANTRQAAIDAARADAKVSGVEVYYYLEVNLVEKAVNDASYRCVANLVLPYVNPDFVSYSSYDSITGSGPPRDVGLTLALKFLSKKLKSKTLSNGLNPGVPAPYANRVFIGEYGFSTGPNWPGKGLQYSMKQATDNMKQVVRVALQQQVPFVLYWQLYNNQVDDMGNQRGWWLIDNHGNKTPMYLLHQAFLASAKAYLAQYKASKGTLPSRSEFSSKALDMFSKL